MAYWEKVIKKFSNYLNVIGSVALILVVIIACANITLRVFQLPIKGAFEIESFLGAIVVSFALGYTQSKRGHISVELFVAHLHAHPRRILQMVIDTITLLLVILVAWRLIVYAGVIVQSGDVSDTLRIRYFPLMYGVALGFIGLALMLALDLLKTIAHEVKK